MADGKTTITYEAKGDDCEIVIRERGRPLASIKLTLTEWIDFAAEMARGCDQLSRRQKKPAIIFPESVVRDRLKAN